MTTISSTVSQILDSLALDLTWVCDRDTAGGLVASRAVSVRTADQAVKLLHDAGYKASFARDEEGVAWLYVALEGWTILPCGGRVLLRDNRPVRISDAGYSEVTEEQIVDDLAEMGWTVIVGKWSVGDEHDATATVTEVTL
jgi:hypothetical protein